MNKPAHVFLARVADALELVVSAAREYLVAMQNEERPPVVFRVGDTIEVVDNYPPMEWASLGEHLVIQEIFDDGFMQVKTTDGKHRCTTPAYVRHVDRKR